MLALTVTVGLAGMVWRSARVGDCGSRTGVECSGRSGKNACRGLNMEKQARNWSGEHMGAEEVSSWRGASVRVTAGKASRVINKRVTSSHGRHDNGMAQQAW